MKNIEETYNWKGIVIAILFIIIGIAILCLNLAINELSFQSLFTAQIFIALFFAGTGIYILKIYIENIFIKPKREIVYLKNMKGKKYIFLDSKGKRYVFRSRKTDKLEIGNYYNSMKTKNSIKEINEISYDSFSISKTKPSFWLNLYTPVINMEDIFLLPILYLMFIIMFLERDNHRINFILMIILGFFIVYDIVYKIKRNRIVEQIEQNLNLVHKDDEINQVDKQAELKHMSNTGNIIIDLIKPIIQILSAFGILLFAISKLSLTAISLTNIVLLVIGLIVLLIGYRNLFVVVKELKKVNR